MSVSDEMVRAVLAVMAPEVARVDGGRREDVSPSVYDQAFAEAHRALQAAEVAEERISLAERLRALASDVEDVEHFAVAASAPTDGDFGPVPEPVGGEELQALRTGLNYLVVECVSGDSPKGWSVQEIKDRVTLVSEGIDELLKENYERGRAAGSREIQPVVSRADEKLAALGVQLTRASEVAGRLDEKRAHEKAAKEAALEQLQASQAREKELEAQLQRLSERRRPEEKDAAAQCLTRIFDEVCPLPFALSASDHALMTEQILRKVRSLRAQIDTYEESGRQLRQRLEESRAREKALEAQLSERRPEEKDEIGEMFDGIFKTALGNIARGMFKDGK